VYTAWFLAYNKKDSSMTQRKKTDTEIQLSMIDTVKKIDTIRQERGWTIYKLSMKTGLTQQAIHAWYNTNNLAIPSTATLEIVCEAFGITLAEFFSEKCFTEISLKHKSLYNNLNLLSNEECTAIDTIVKSLVKTNLNQIHPQKIDLIFNCP
jgi:transcriptional regulator with XRE-family HTH domain